MVDSGTDAREGGLPYVDKDSKIEALEKEVKDL